MTGSSRLFGARAIACLLAVGLAGPLVTGNRVRAQEAKPPKAGQEAKPPEATKEDPDRARQISELEGQIKALTGKLEELRKPKADPAKPVEASPVLDRWIQSLKWRSIGPATMGGRIVALSVLESDPSTYYVATGGGGLLKTENNGITFAHLFDRETTVAIGDVCVAPSDRNVVWVGTGENNPRNSVSYGDGVYKSTDAGKTWTHMGLKDTFQIGRIVVHPKDPNIVYVGALGRLYGPNPERGLFKTTDGGKTWEKVLFVDDRTGVIDVQMDPSDPETLLVATYERKRDGFDVGDPEVKYGPGAGIHKTTDGGKTWKKLTKGLPTVPLGRIGIDFYRKNPKVVFAIIESEKIGTGPTRAPGAGTAYMGVRGETEGEKAIVTFVAENGPAAKAGLNQGDVITSFGDKPLKDYQGLIDQLAELKPDDKVKLKVLRDDKPLELEVTLAKRPEGAQGGDPNRPFGSNLGGQRENAQDRQGPEGYQTGGVYRSEDGGESWTRVNSLNPRPMYFSQVRVDPSDEKYVYVLGIALYRSSDGGKTFKSDGGNGVHADQHALWIDARDGRHMLVGCDGGVYASYDRMDHWDHLNHMALGQFYDVAIDTRRNYRAFGGLQDNGSWGGPSRTGDGSGPLNEDWLRISGGDGFQCQVDAEDPDVVYTTSQYGVVMRRNLRTGETSRLRPRAPEGKPQRWNWNTPVLLSSRNPRILYTAGNYVYRSLDRGEDLRPISGEITRSDKGSATALAESPRNSDVIYVGTDDGALWVTRDGGKAWTDIVKNVQLPKPFHVASIEASRFADGRVYVAFDAHRSDDDAPYLFASEDYGQTWTRLGPALPRGSTHCLREDVQNQDLLFAGTEFAAWVSIDRGKTWNKLNSNLPTVAVFDYAVHPTAGEIVAATHGRSLWVLDISALRQIKPEMLESKAQLYRPISAIRWRPEPGRGGTNRRYVGENPPRGAQIFLSLGGKPEKVSLKVLDPEGQTVRELRPKAEAGLQQLAWDLTRTAEPPAGAQRPGSTAAALAEVVRRRAAQNLPGRPVPPGTYRLVLEADGQTLSQQIRVEPDPSLTAEEIAEQYQGGAVESDAAEAEEPELDDPDERPIVD